MIVQGNERNSFVKGEVTNHVPQPDGLLVLNRDIAAGAAGADINGAAEMFYSVPADKELIITGARVVAIGTAVGIDADNTCKVTVQNTATTPVVYASKTFSDDPAFPAAKQTGVLTLQDNIKVKAGEKLTYTVTQGTTADHNGFTLMVEGILRDISPLITDVSKLYGTPEA